MVNNRSNNYNTPPIPPRSPHPTMSVGVAVERMKYTHTHTETKKSHRKNPSTDLPKKPDFHRSLNFEQTLFRLC